MMLETPEDILPEDVNALSMIQLPVNTDMALQDVFQVAKSGNQANQSINTGDTFEIDSQSSALNDSASISFIEDSVFTDKSVSLDWLNENMNFESEVNFSGPIAFQEDIYVNYAQSSELNFDEMQTSIPSLQTGLQLHSDLKQLNSFCEDSNVIPLATAIDLLYNNQTESTETLEGHNLETSSACDDSQSVSSSEKITSASAGEKYLEMRRKNNIASQRSRRLRKLKDMKMDEKLKKLQSENKKLLLIAESLEKKRDALQKYLLQVITKKGS